MTVRLTMWKTELLEKIVTWVAWHLPKNLVYWAFIRLAAHATTGKYGNTHPDELSVMEALNRWE